MKMTRLNRSETFKVLQWMTTHRELLEPKSASDALLEMKAAGQPELPVGMYNRMRNDLGWDTARHRGEQNAQDRLAKLEQQVAELQAIINAEPWNNPRLL